jgi:hypothetical protein
MAWEDRQTDINYEDKRRNKMEVKGKILAKKGDNKAFKLDDSNWYNLNDNVIPYLEKLSKGDEVVVTYEKKGVSRHVSKLTGAFVEPKTETTSTLGFICEVCGKELKDDKFKKCFLCNKNKAVKKEDPAPGVTEPKKPYTPYDNPEKTAMIQKGNALNAAGAAISGNLQGADPDTIAQGLIMVAERALEWLKTE